MSKTLLFILAIVNALHISALICLSVIPPPQKITTSYCLRCSQLYSVISLSLTLFDCFLCVSCVLMR